MPMSDLRKEFHEIMCELAEKDKDVILITGDLGYSFNEEFQKRFPKQFINCGCIEQSMVAIASGMAIAGKKPYIYSGTIFALMRPYEFVRDDVAYNNLDVKIIGTGASGFLGFTHNLQGDENEDDLLKNLPNIRICHPRDKEQLTKCLLLAGPSFLRI
jgi:transketolase